MKQQSLQIVRCFLALSFMLMGGMLLAQEAPISFWIENVESYVPYPISTPWLFDADDPGFVTEDTNPFTFMDINLAYKNYAYKYFYSTLDPVAAGVEPTSSYCTEENLWFVEGTDGFRVEFQDFTLTALQKVNTINPGAAWNIRGQAGDIRIYTGGLGLIYLNDELVLRVRDCVLKVFVSYPTAAQMQELIPTWQLAVGSGAPTEVEGWGTVDVENSNVNWANAFADPEAGNRIDFLMDTVDHVIQNQYGYYSFNLSLVPSDHAIMMDHVIVPELPGNMEFPSLDIGFDFSEVELGGDNEDLADLLIFQIEEPPVDIIPAVIKQVLPEYWHFSTTLSSFTTDITFDLSGKNLGDPASWQILRKGDLEDLWQVWGDFTVLDANRIRANNVSAFSDWTVGSSEEATLPVVMSSFMAVQASENCVNLKWISQSESGLSGFRVLRSEAQDMQTAIIISNLISATNSSTAVSYNYLDSDVVSGCNYSYWLQVVEMDGSDSFYGPVNILLNEGTDPEHTPDLEFTTAIRKIFPNPATSATIDIALAKAGNISVDVYNLRGQKVKSMFAGHKDAGTFYLNWNGTDDAGRACASGVYYIVLNTNDRVSQRHKLLLMK